jgi:hypothetical protein
MLLLLLPLALRALFPFLRERVTSSARVQVSLQGMGLHLAQPAQILLLLLLLLLLMTAHSVRQTGTSSVHDVRVSLTWVYCCHHHL